MAPNIDPQGYQITLPPTDGPHPFWEEPSPPPAGQGIPAGGTTGQVLKKHSNEDYDVEWADETGGGGSGGDLPTGGQDGDLLTKDNTVSGGAVWKTPDFADHKDVEELAGEIAHASADIILLKKDMTQVKEEDISQNAAIASQSERTGTLERDMTAVKEKNNEQDTALESQGAAIAAQQTELSNVKKTVGDLNTKVTTLGADVEQVKTENATQQQEVEALQTAVAAVRQVPEGGNTGQVVKKTADGYDWGDVAGSGPNIPTPAYPREQNLFLNSGYGSTGMLWTRIGGYKRIDNDVSMIRHTFKTDDTTFISTTNFDLAKFDFGVGGCTIHIEATETDSTEAAAFVLSPVVWGSWSSTQFKPMIAEFTFADGCKLEGYAVVATAPANTMQQFDIEWKMTFPEGVTEKIVAIEYIASYMVKQ